ncbi:MAG: TMEM165/GDT1 family protein [Clostridia bacterium]|nr:TMEM165/GDT1 family protein [Clostridia bacterium]
MFGIIGFIPKKEDRNNSSFLNKLTNIRFSYIFIIAFSIIIGELGDKTFLASLGLGLQYPNHKISLIIGSISGMVASNSIALFFGKILGNKLNQNFVEILSNIIFIVFGLIGFIGILF